MITFILVLHAYCVKAMDVMCVYVISYVCYVAAGRMDGWMDGGMDGGVDQWMHGGIVWLCFGCVLK